MTAKITVLTAVLNQADALRETIRSVCDQSYPNLDFFVVDGGSADGTLDVIRSREKQLSGWISEIDEGIYDAMNKGWSMAGDDSYVLFLGAGDCLLDLPKELPVPGRSPYIYYGRGMLDGGREFVSHANWRLKLYNALHHQALLIPKRLHPEPPFDTCFRLYADFDFNQRLMKMGVPFRFISGLSAYASPGGMTASTDIIEMTDIVRKNYGIFWWLLSRAGFETVKYLPFLKKLRPIR